MKLTAPLLVLGVLVIEMGRNGTLAGGSAGLVGGVFFKGEFLLFQLPLFWDIQLEPHKIL